MKKTIFGVQFEWPLKTGLFYIQQGKTHCPMNGQQPQPLGTTISITLMFFTYMKTDTCTVGAEKERQDN